jgi:thiamine-phosphate pyrophosphorylase
VTTGRRERLRSARLYLVCDARDDRFLESALRGGVDIVQLRLKDADDEKIVAAGRRLAGLCAARGALFILNDRPDLAAAASADGVHVGQDDMPVAQARAVVGSDLLVGLSTHTPAQVDLATPAGDDSAAAPDYIGVGPVYATPTKPGREAVGLELVRYAAREASVPFFAIGGIDAQTVSDVVRAGARRIAVVRALVEAADPEAAARRLRAALEDEREPVGAA